MRNLGGNRIKRQHQIQSENICAIYTTAAQKKIRWKSDGPIISQWDSSGFVSESIIDAAALLMMEAMMVMETEPKINYINSLCTVYCHKMLFISFHDACVMDFFIPK